MDYLQIAEAYYLAMNEKNVAKLKSYLRPDAMLISPLAGETQGGSIFEAIGRFMTYFTSLKIRSKCGYGNQVMLAIDVEYPLPIGKLKTAVLMTFQGDQIASIELFHDTKPFHGLA
ncbi:MAG TPA: hypothetical protein VGJ00_02740 [Rhabdochlamydiaceae bacterium]|jgi:hypothetical protein